MAPTPTQAGQAAAGPIPYIDILVASLMQLGLAAPLVITAVKAFQALLRKRGAPDPHADLTDAQIIDLVEAALKKVATDAQAEIDRLREKIAAGEDITHG